MNVEKAYADLLDPARIPDPRDALRAADAVRQAREAAEGLDLGAADAAGAAVLWLAARMDTGSSILTGERQKLAHSVAMALLLRTPRGHELLDEAGWRSILALRHYDRLVVAYSRFRTWIDSVAAELHVGEVRGPRVGLALAAARAESATDAGDRNVARLVTARGRKMPVEPGDVPAGLLLACAQGASVDGLLRKTPHGLRWVERRARDVLEKVIPPRDPVDENAVTGEEQADHAPDPAKVAEASDMFDAIAALGDATDRAILEGRCRGETYDELGRRLGMSGRAVRKRRCRIRERAARLIG